MPASFLLCPCNKICALFSLPSVSLLLLLFLWLFLFLFYFPFPSLRPAEGNSLLVVIKIFFHLATVKYFDLTQNVILPLCQYQIGLVFFFFFLSHRDISIRMYSTVDKGKEIFTIKTSQDTFHFSVWTTIFGYIWHHSQCPFWVHSQYFSLTIRHICCHYFSQLCKNSNGATQVPLLPKVTEHYLCYFTWKEQNKAKSFTESAMAGENIPVFIFGIVLSPWMKVIAAWDLPRHTGEQGL